MNKNSIIGEDPTKYWEKYPVICKLEIINLDLIIKTKDIQYGNFEQEECKSHIKTLLDLKVMANLKGCSIQNRRWSNNNQQEKKKIEEKEKEKPFTHQHHPLLLSLSLSQ